MSGVGKATASIGKILSTGLVNLMKMIRNLNVTLVR